MNLEAPNPESSPEEGKEMPSRPVWEKRLVLTARKHPQGIAWEELMREAFPNGSNRFEATSQRGRLLREGVLVEMENGLYVYPSLVSVKGLDRRRRST